MRIVQCDLAGCTTDVEIYEQILAALEAPDWHGHSLDALWDSVAGGDINGRQPPCQFKVSGYSGLQKKQSDLVERIAAQFLEVRRGNPVSVELVMV